MIKNISLTVFSCIIILLFNSNCLCHSNDEPEKIYSWNEMMDSCTNARKSQNHQAALEWALKAELKARKEFGKSDTNYVKTLGEISLVYNDMREFDSAIIYGEMRVNCNRKIYKTDNKELANSLAWLASFYSNKFELEKAQPYWIEALEIYRRITLVENNNLAQCIFNLGYNYLKLNDIKKAEPLFLEGLEMTRRIYKNADHPDVVNVIYKVAKFYTDIQKYSESEKFYKEAVEMSERYFKTDHPFWANCIYNLGYFYNEINEFDKADSLYNMSLEMKRRYFKTDHLELARFLNNVGIFYYDQGQLAKAERLYLDGFEMFRRLYKTDQVDLAACINNVGRYYQNLGDYTKAEQYYIESLGMLRRIFKSDHQDLPRIISNLGVFYNELGDFSKADKLLEEALAMARRIFKNDNIEFSRIISKIALCYFERGDIKKAEPLIIEFHEMMKGLYKSDNRDLAKSYTALAVLYKDLGDNSKAEPLYLEALNMNRRIFKNDNPELAGTLGNTGAFYVDMGEFDKAEKYFTEALDMYRRIYTTDNQSLATAINNLGYFYNKKGDYANAEQLYLEALEMRRRLSKSDNHNLALSISNLACFYSETGNLEKAKPLFEESNKIYRRLYRTDHQEKAGNTYHYANFLFNEGELSNAEDFYKESLNIYKNVFLKQSVSLSESEKEKYWSTMNNRFESFYTFVVNRAVDSPEILGYTFDNVLFTKALIFNSANKIKKRIIESGDSALIKKYKELSSSKELLIKLYSLSANELKKQGYNIDSIETRANNLEKELNLQSEAFKQSYEKKKVSWKTIQAILKPDEAAIEMVRFRKYKNSKFTDSVFYAALIISDQTEDYPEMIIIENGKELEDNYYNSYRSNIKIKAKESESFNVFWKKIHEKTKDYKKIYFSPDGIYNKLNIGTFEVEPGKYLLDCQKIHQLNSTQDILLGYYSNQEDENVYNSAILIGNPDFNLSQDKVMEREVKLLNERNIEERGSKPTKSLSLAPLPGTEKEIENIAKYLKSKKWDIHKFTNEDAVKASVKSANSPRVLHIATHGLFLEDIKTDETQVLGMETKRVKGNPLLRSGLFFAGASTTSSENFRPNGYDNGFLTAYEAQNLNLDKTDLVVLSACETGLGEIKNGEGVFGLQRAFIQAGAKSVIMSLWSVSDEATQELMSTFYKEWLSGKTKRDAFRLAQMKLKEKFPAPYYWGAFVMVGE